VAPHHRAEDDGAAPKLRRAQRTLAGAAGTLLPPRLLRRALNFANALGLVRAGAALRQLPVDHARENVAAHGHGENLVSEFDLAGALVVKRLDRGFHPCAPSAPAAARSAAGKGRPLGAGRFAASFTST